MAKKRGGKVIEVTKRTIDPDWEEEKEPEQQIDQEDMEMEAVSRMFPGGLRCVSLYRMAGPQGGRPSFIAEVPPDQFKEAVIQKMFGGGSYFGRWERKDGKVIRYTFDIEGPAKVMKGEEEEEEVVYAMPPQQATGEKPISAMDLMNLMNNARKEARSEMKDMLELMRPPAPPPDATKQVLDLVTQLAPFMGGAEGGGGSPIMMALTHFKDPIIKLLDTLTMAATRPPVPVSGTPATRPPMQPAAAAQPAATAQPTEDEMIKLMLKGYLPLLINAAAKNADPDIYADMVLDQIPDSLHPQVLTWLEKPNCLDIIVELEPGVKFQLEWWQSLRVALVETLRGANDATSHLQPSESVQSESTASE